MKKADVKIGRCYAAKVSGTIQAVKILGAHWSYGLQVWDGWDAVNVRTKRGIHIKSAQRLRYEVTEGSCGTTI